MTEILAVKPENGRVVHLHLPTYQPGRKRRSIREFASLCNVGVSRAEKAPLSEALKWDTPDPATAVRPAWNWEWCRVCVGHAVAIAGMQREVLAAVVARDSAEVA